MPQENFPGVYGLVHWRSSTKYCQEQGNLLRGIDNKTVRYVEFQFVYICSLLKNSIFWAELGTIWKKKNFCHG